MLKFITMLINYRYISYLKEKSIESLRLIDSSFDPYGQAEDIVRAKGFKKLSYNEKRLVNDCLKDYPKFKKII